VLFNVLGTKLQWCCGFVFERQAMLGHKNDPAMAIGTVVRRREPPSVWTLHLRTCAPVNL
jgi:hypothetical protein